MPESRKAAPDGDSTIAAALGQGVSRRSFIQTIGVSAAATSLAPAAEALARRAEEAPADAVPIIGPDAFEATLRVNGRPLKAKIEPATTLLEALRLHLGLTGTKEVCDRGSCGACSVLVDGKLMVSCMMLAVDAVGSEITTVEGMGKDGAMDLVQEAFVRHDALQCGFCTPGLVVAVRALLNETPRPTLEQIKHGLAGNICRCGTYTNVFNATLEASGQKPIQDTKEA